MGGDFVPSPRGRLWRGRGEVPANHRYQRWPGSGEVLASHRRRRWLGREDGALTLSYVVVIPVFLLAIMVIAQAAVWYLARETAIAAARQGADVARTAHPPPGRGAQAAVAFAHRAAPGFLLGPAATAAGSSPTTVRIVVTGRVPSLVPGLALTVSEVVTAPVERFTAAGPRGERLSRVPVRGVRGG